MLKLERESWMRRGQFRTIWREKGFKCSGGNPMYVGWRIYGVRNCCRRLAHWWSKYFNSNLPRCCVGAETSPGWHHRHFTLLSELLLIISTQLFSVADVPSHNMRSSAPLCMQSGGPAGQGRCSCFLHSGSQWGLCFTHWSLDQGLAVFYCWHFELGKMGTIN